jgi:Transposase DDE domain
MDANIFDSAGWHSLRSLLPTDFRERAVKLNLCRSQPSKTGERAKLKDPETLLRLVLHHVATDTPLDLTVAQAHAINLVSVSKVALHLRMRTVGPWLSELAASVSNADTLFAPERWGGYRVFCTDATCGARPGACGTSFRVHCRLEAATMRPQQWEITDVHGGEMLRRFKIEADDLDLLDRAYCNAHDIEHADKARGKVIVRYARTSLPLFDRRGRAIDIKPRVLRIKRAGQVKEWAVRVHGPEGSVITGRIVAMRLSAEQTGKAIARLRREKKAGEITPEDLAWSQFVVVFTTVPTNRLSSVMVLELYRLRWLVELEFKREKSIGGLDRLPNFRDDTIASWVAGKLLAFALARRSVEGAFPPGGADEGPGSDTSLLAA